MLRLRPANAMILLLGSASIHAFEHQRCRRLCIQTELAFVKYSQLTLAFSCGARSAFKLGGKDYLRSTLSRRQLQGFVGPRQLSQLGCSNARFSTSFYQFILNLRTAFPCFPVHGELWFPFESAFAHSDDQSLPPASNKRNDDASD